MSKETIEQRDMRRAFVVLYDLMRARDIPYPFAVIWQTFDKDGNQDYTVMKRADSISWDVNHGDKKERMADIVHEHVREKGKMSNTKIWLCREDIENALDVHSHDASAYENTWVRMRIKVPPQIYPPNNIVEDAHPKNWVLVSVLSDDEALTEISDDKSVRDQIVSLESSG